MDPFSSGEEQRGYPLTLIEWGGGTGKLAKDVLDALEIRSPELYKDIRYIGVETSRYHREPQREMLAAHAGRVELLSAEEWFGRSPWPYAVLWSNELIDAMPVHLVQYEREAGWLEIGVAWDAGEGSFVERKMPLTNPEVLGYIRLEGIPERDGQRFEVNLAGGHWLQNAAGHVESGWSLTIDYGDTAEELYRAHRMKGTPLCYREHLASDTPLALAGSRTSLLM
ncbi:SAM-dependent methyltransferase [Paenibacillus sp. P26]|nr:SAM-dependent methyltransferase [Paenibacillus sp. P26]